MIELTMKKELSDILLTKLKLSKTFGKILIDNLRKIEFGSISD